MYTKSIPFKDFNGKPRNQTITLNLETREVFKLLNEFQRIFKWRESMGEGSPRDLTTAEVVEFYNDLEVILLASWGELSEDGLHFRKTGRYEFEESALFSAVMNLFVSEPAEANRMLDGLMPKGMAEMVEKANANLEQLGEDPNTSNELKAEIARLRAQLPAGSGE